MLPAILALWYFMYLFFITWKKHSTESKWKLQITIFIHTELAFHSSQVLKLQMLFHKENDTWMKKNIINKLTVTRSLCKMNHHINPCVLVDIISIKLYFTNEKSNRPYTEFCFVFVCNQSERVIAQAPYNQETLTYSCSAWVWWSWAKLPWS